MKDISLRIKSIKSTRQITKAMELVATSKLNKAKERIARSRSFYTKVYSSMCDIAAMNLEMESRYLEKRDVKKTCYIVIAGDRGLAGGYNSNVFRFAEGQLKDKDVMILPIGKRSAEYYTKRGYEIVTDEFTSVETLNIGSCHEISSFITHYFLNKEFDELYIIYTKYISVLEQQPSIKKLLPIDNNLCMKGSTEKKELILFEPSVSSVFDAIIPSYTAGMIWGCVCESTTSEFAARHTAMEAASKNAEDMIEDLSLKYNRARQGSITQEITEIVAGSGL